MGVLRFGRTDNNINYDDDANWFCKFPEVFGKDGFFEINLKENETPNRMYFIFEVDIGDSDLVDCTVRFDIPECTIKYPTVKFYDAWTYDYWKEGITPLRAVYSPSRIITDNKGGTGFEEKNGVYYDYTDITKEGLKRLLVELDFSRCKTPTGYCRINDNVELEVLVNDFKDKYNVQVISNNYVTDNHINLPENYVNHEVTYVNKGKATNVYFQTTCPAMTEISSVTGYDTHISGNLYSIYLKEGENRTVTTKIFIGVLGSYDFSDIWNYTTDTTIKGVFHDWTVSLNPVDVTDEWTVINTYPLWFLNGEQYIDVRFSTDSTITVGTVDYQINNEYIKDNTHYEIVLKKAILIDHKDNVNVDSVGYSNTGITIIKQNNTEPFTAWVRLYYNPVMGSDDYTLATYLTDIQNWENYIRSAEITITSEATLKDYTQSYYILPPKGHQLNFKAPHYYYNHKPYVSCNINGTGQTIRCKSSKRNFFRLNQPNVEVNIEDLIKHIGPLKLTREHSADVTANLSNSLIENRFENRVYMGKKGDLKEEIDMTLRLPKTGVATLQGLTELDKPVSVDVLPYFPDGDPLNHRGWAEIYGVKNVKKINDLLYQCDVNLSYFTHKLNTMFSINKNGLTNTYTPKYYLTEAHEYTDYLSEIFNISPLNNFVDIENDDGSIVGNYTLYENDKITFTNSHDVAGYSDWKFKWRHMLPVYESEDQDGTWAMTLSLYNAETKDLLLEYIYHDFKHYNHTTDKLLNQCSTTLRSLKTDGTYDTKSYSNVSLRYNDLTPFSNDNKIDTVIVLENDTVIEDGNESLLFKLTDVFDNELVDKSLHITVADKYGVFYDYDLLTDYYGRVELPCNFKDGLYSIQVAFDTDEGYNGVNYVGNFTVSYDRIKTQLIVGNVYKKDTSKTVQLVDTDGSPIPLARVYYSFKPLNQTLYGGRQYLLTDSEGKVEIPVTQQNNGTTTLKVEYEGNSKFASSYKETECLISNTDGNGTQIISNDMEYVAGNPDRQFSIILRDLNEKPLTGKPIKFLIYDTKQTFVKTATTSSNGSATIGINLGYGNWRIDSIYEGDKSEYLPVVTTNIVQVKNNTKKKTSLKGSNVLIDSSSDSNYKVTLRDENNVKLPNKPITFEIVNQFYGVIYTDSNGEAYLPYRGSVTNTEVKASFLGDSAYQSSYLKDKVNYIYEVGAIETSITVNSDGSFKLLDKNNAPLIGENVLVTITDSNDENFKYSIQKTVTTVDGNTPIPNLSTGIYYININYQGNPSFRWANGFKLITVTSETGILSTTVTDLTVPSIITTNRIFNASAILKDSNNKGLEGCLIKISDGANTTYSISGENGIFNFDLLAKSQSDLTFTSETDYLHSDLNQTITNAYTSTFSPTLSLNTLKVARINNSSELTNNQDLQIDVTNYYKTAESTLVVGDYVKVKAYNSLTNEYCEYECGCNDLSTPSYLSFFLEKGRWNINVMAYGLGGYTDRIVNLTARIDNDISVAEGSFDDTNNYFVREDVSYLDFAALEFSEYKDKLVGVVKDINLTDSGDLSITYLTYDDLSSMTKLSDLGDCVDYDSIIAYDDNNLQFSLFTPSVNSDLTKLVKDIEGTEKGQLKVTRYQTVDFTGIKKCNRIVLKADVSQLLLTETVTLQATCYDSVNTPVENAKINFFNRKGTLLGTAYSDSNGVATGTFTITNDSIVNKTITPSGEEYDGLTYGSTLSLNIRNNKLSIVDYGYGDENRSPKITEKNIEVPSVDKYSLEYSIEYTNTGSDSLNPLDGLLQVYNVSDTTTSEKVNFYEDLIVSPSRIPYATCLMTRECEEGRLYYYKYDEAHHEYLCSPFNQYKGGTELVNEFGSNIFNLENNYSPVYMQNGLIRIGFHRRTGYIILYTYNYKTGEYLKVGNFKIDNYPELTIPSSFNDDKCTLKFGDTYWTIWRGKPYVELRHYNTDITILSDYNRLMCETQNNTGSLDLISTVGVSNGIFNTEVTTQLFKQEMEIGENLSLENFEAYNILHEGYYHNSEFYYDTSFKDTVKMAHQTGEFYYDRLTKSRYLYNGTNYEKVED